WWRRRAAWTRRRARPPAAPVERSLRFPSWFLLRVDDVHPHDKTVAEGVHVLHDAVVEDSPVLRTNDLVHVDDDTPVLVADHPGRLDVRVRRLELTGPIGPDLVMAVDANAIDDIGPVDINVGVGQHRVDVTLVERRVGTAQELLDARRRRL